MLHDADSDNGEGGTKYQKYVRHLCMTPYGEGEERGAIEHVSSGTDGWGWQQRGKKEEELHRRLSLSARRVGNSLRVQRGNLKSLNVADSSVEPAARKVGTAETDGCPLASPPLS